ncbi:MAG: hypothetical protein HY288_01115 [Planctomycetia bacterium]|nr:hypothetical protein [Planctomycetia bacterium]
MNLVLRARILSVATLACLAAPAAWSAQPGGGPLFQNLRSEMSIDAPADFARRTTARSGRLVAQLEPIAMSTASDDVVPTRDSSTWEENDGSDTAVRADDWSNGRFRRGLWYAGLDYLLIRPRFSQAIAESRTTTTADNTNTPTSSTSAAQDIQFPFKYQSSFRASLGYRLLDCGGDVSVTYWRLTGTAHVHDGPSNLTGNPSVSIASVLETNTQSDNEFFSTNSGVTANILDVDFAKCLSLGGPRNPCDCCFCPRWDLRWSAGARIADVTRFNNNAFSDASGNHLEVANINARFVGAGPRVGLQGRRYFGRTGLLSVYAKANTALLIGDYRTTRSKTEFNTAPAPTEFDIQTGTMSRIIPVTDIEIGGSWQVAPYTFLSAGWFFQAWWDLGQGETIDNRVTGFTPLDTSNILGFDGLFARGEILF